MEICMQLDCPLYEPDQEECDDCINGRFIGAVCEYASTCDGCGELTHHELLTMDKKTEMGYCPVCRRQSARARRRSKKSQ